MNVLIITSCTGEKAVESDQQLTREDFALGEQHVRLMRGVSAMRSTLDSGRSTVSLHVLSAGYGMIPEDRVVASLRDHVCHDEGEGAAGMGGFLACAGGFPMDCRCAL